MSRILSMYIVNIIPFISNLHHVKTPKHFNNLITSHIFSLPSYKINNIIDTSIYNDTKTSDSIYFYKNVAYIKNYNLSVLMHVSDYIPYMYMFKRAIKTFALYI